jgi:CRISPR-associated protein Csy1
VVLVSSGFRECTVGAYFGAWVGALAAAGWDTHVVQLGPRHDATTARLIAAAGHGGVVGGPLDAIAASIRELAADVVILPEIGMDMRMQSLATVALGARMLAAWGHPVTTGYTHFCGYLTAAGMEPADAAAHYVEPLLPLPGLGTAYAAPPAPARRTRAELGLPAGRLYVVPQSAFKLHPDDDAAIALLAARDPAATIALVPADRPHAQQRHAARLARAVSAAGGDPSRLLWLPPLSRSGFLEVLAAADVMLDTTRWSGGNTTLDALRAGLPVVACPGAQMRGRQSAAMLRSLGLEAELVLHDRVSQVARAIAIADDGALRERIARAIGGGFPALVDGREALDALVAHLDALRSAA